MFNNIDHLLNKLCEFIDDEEPEIHAIAYRRHAQSPERFRDELRLLLGGERVSAYATFSSHIRPAAHLCRVYGDKGTLTVDYTSRTVTTHASARLPSALGRVLPPFAQAIDHLREGAKNVERFARADFQFFAGLEHLIRSFYTSIRDDRDPPVPDRDMLRIASWMHRIMAQIDSAPISGKQESA